jgi:hypothetical protein
VAAIRAGAGGSAAAVSAAAASAPAGSAGVVPAAAAGVGAGPAKSSAAIETTSAAAAVGPAVSTALVQQHAGNWCTGGDKKTLPCPALPIYIFFSLLSRSLALFLTHAQTHVRLESANLRGLTKIP